MFQSNAEELRQAVLRATQRAIASNIVRHNQVTGDKSIFKLSLELHIACSRRAQPQPAPALPAAPEVGEHHFTLLWALFYFIRWKLCWRQTPESGEQEKLRSIEVIQCQRCFFKEMLEYFLLGQCPGNIRPTPTPARAPHLFWIMETASQRRDHLM